MTEQNKKTVSEVEVKSMIQLRYFKLMFPDITESDAEIVASSLAKALTDKFHIIPRDADPAKFVEYDFKCGKFQGLKWRKP